MRVLACGRSDTSVHPFAAPLDLMITATGRKFSRYRYTRLASSGQRVVIWEYTCRWLTTHSTIKWPLHERSFARTRTT